ncbi:MAG: hypothetical protein WCK96_18005 [Methylococcales bacterium]
MKLLIVLMLCSTQVIAVPLKNVWWSVNKVSVYQDGDICTQSLLIDGVCPDYLQGGCATRRECFEVLEDRLELGYEQKRRALHRVRLDFN